MPMMDEREATLKMIAEYRDEIVKRIVGGAVSVENVENGYRECVGILKGLEKAEEFLNAAYRRWDPDPEPEKPRVYGRLTGDY